MLKFISRFNRRRRPSDLKVPNSWIMKDEDQRGQVENILKAPSAAANNLDHSWSRCWFYGGRKTGEPEEKTSRHGRDQLRGVATEGVGGVTPPPPHKVFKYRENWAKLWYGKIGLKSNGA